MMMLLLSVIVPTVVDVIVDVAADDVVVSDCCNCCWCYCCCCCWRCFWFGNSRPLAYLAGTFLPLTFKNVFLTHCWCVDVNPCPPALEQMFSQLCHNHCSVLFIVVDATHHLSFTVEKNSNYICGKKWSVRLPCSFSRIVRFSENFSNVTYNKRNILVMSFR